MMEKPGTDFINSFNSHLDVFLRNTRALQAELIFDNTFKGLIKDYWNTIIGNEEAKLQLQDAFFTKFSVFWKYYVDFKDFRNGHRFWQQLAQLAFEWDEKHKRNKLHKGSLYYFWGANYLFEGDIDEAYTLIHQALIEDIRSQKHKTKRPDTPAFWFVSLSEKEQFLGHYVQSQILFLKSEIDEYNKKNNRQFSFEDLKKKFLEGIYVDEIILFSFIISKFIEMSSEQLILFRNKFTNLTFISLLFDLTIIIEKLLKSKIGNTLLLKALIQNLSKQNNLAIKTDIDLFNKKLKTAFDKYVKSVIRHTYQLQNNSKLNNIEEGLYISYAIRNHRAHNVKSLEVISKDNKSFFTAILHTMFYVIDYLY